MTRKTNYLILLISTFGLISFFKFKYPVYQEMANSINVINDSSKVDTFQDLIYDLCRAKSIKFSLEKEIDGKNKQLLIYTKLIDSKTLEKNKYLSLKLEIIDMTKMDSLLLKNDSLKRLYTDTKKIELSRYDSLIINIDQGILLIKNLINESKKQTDSLRNELTQKLISFNIKLKNIRRYSSKIHGSVNFDLCGVKYNFFVADLNQDEIRLHLFKKNNQNYSSIGSVLQYLEEKKIEPLMITNAGMFNPSHEPVGLYIEEGSKIQFKLDTLKKNTEENFYLFPNGVFCIDTHNVCYVLTTENFVKLQKEKKIKVKVASQSGPMLLINGKIHPKFKEGSTNEKIRSGVGKISDKKMVFAITNNESNFYDFASFFKEIFDCNDALFFDGVISKMYLKDIDPNVTGGNFGPMISVSKKP